MPPLTIVRSLLLASLLIFFGAFAHVAYASLPAPSILVDPASIFSGQSSTLYWDSGPNSNLNQCTASGFDNTYTIPGYWTTGWDCWDFGCWEYPYYVDPVTVEEPSGSASVSPANTTTYSYSCNRYETFGIGASCYGYATDNGWGWGRCWGLAGAGATDADVLCHQRGYASASSYAAGGGGGRVCNGSADDWSNWRCDSNCSSSCGGTTLTSVTCTNAAPVTVSATLSVSPPVDLTATMLGP